MALEAMEISGKHCHGDSAYLLSDSAYLQCLGVRAGGGRGGGAAAPPKILGNSDFLGSKRNLGKASF